MTQKQLNELKKLEGGGMIDIYDYLGKKVVVKTAQGDIVGVGECVCGTTAPTLGINLPDGRQIHWRADLCEITGEEAAA